MTPVRLPAGTSKTEFVIPEGLVASRLLMGREAMAWTLPEQIGVALAERILREEFAPGNRIGEEGLSKEFRVSRGPIRDALRLLENVGLVTITSRRGAVASALHVDDLREIFELRGSLLELAILGFRRIIDAALLEEFGRYVASLEMVPSEERMSLVYTDAVDRAMLFIAHHCGNGRIARILTTLSLQSFRYLRRGQNVGPQATPRRNEIKKFYRDLLTALEKGRDLEPLFERLRQVYLDRERNIADYLP
jgi:DNA-binding GntR family transcriptional regulator